MSIQNTTIVAGTASSTAYGILALSTNAGSISVITSTGVTINSHLGGAGINAVNEATSIASSFNSSVVVTNAATIHSGGGLTGFSNQPAGILAGYIGGTSNPSPGNLANYSVNGEVVVNNSGDIIADSGDGIRAYNYGVGDVTVNTFGGSITALGGNGAGVGIMAQSFGPGSVRVTTSASTTISAGGYGIGAFGYNGGNVTITNYAIVNGRSAAIDATTTAGGIVIIDNFGMLVGNIISSNVTFHNELGALWYLSGNNSFAATDTLINDGTINLQSGTFNVATSVTGAGTFTVASGSTLEFGSSVATGTTVSFLGASGTLRLDNSLTALFNGQISGLDGTALSHDNIDLRDLAWSALVTAQYQATGVNAGILTISDGIGHTEAFNLINYTGSGHFDVQNDGQGGTLVFDDEALSMTGDITVVAVKGSAVVIDSADLLAVDPNTTAANLVHAVRAEHHGPLLGGLSDNRHRPGHLLPVLLEVCEQLDHGPPADARSSRASRSAHGARPARCGSRGRTAAAAGGHGPYPRRIVHDYLTRPHGFKGVGVAVVQRREVLPHGICLTCFSGLPAGQLPRRWRSPETTASRTTRPSAAWPSCNGTLSPPAPFSSSVSLRGR